MANRIRALTGGGRRCGKGTLCNLVAGGVLGAGVGVVAATMPHTREVARPTGILWLMGVSRVVGDEVVTTYEVAAAKDDGVVGYKEAENANPGDLALIESVGVWTRSDEDDTLTTTARRRRAW